MALGFPRVRGGAARAWTLAHQTVALALLLVIALVPLALVTLPPLVDYPNHLARMHLLFETAASDPVRAFYQPAWSALPNLAMEGVMPLLLRAMDLETAGRLFIALTLALMASGAAALHHALHGRVSPWPLVAVLLLYNRILLWGFLNYLFALGLALWLLAFWIRGSSVVTLRRALVFSIGATLLMYAHLFAFGFYALCVIAYEGGRGGRSVTRSWASRLHTACAAGAPPLLLFFALSPTRVAVTWFEYGAPVRKLAAVGSLFNNYDRGLDAATFAIVAALLGWALLRRRLILLPAMRVPLLVLTGAFVFMPGTVLTSQGADTRFVIGIALLFVAATDLRLDPVRWRALLVGLLFALFCIRLVVIVAHWRDADATYAEFTRAFAQLPPASRLYTIDLHETEWRPFPVPTAHIACLAVIGRAAFVPTVFAHATQQPLRMAPSYAALAARTPTAVRYRGQAMPWADVERDYTHLLLIDRGPLLPAPREYELLWHAPTFRLYRIRDAELASPTKEPTNHE